MGMRHGLNGSTARSDYWDSIGHVHPLPIKTEEAEEGRRLSWFPSSFCSSSMASDKRARVEAEEETAEQHVF